MEGITEYMRKKAGWQAVAGKDNSSSTITTPTLHWYYRLSYSVGHHYLQRGACSVTKGGIDGLLHSGNTMEEHEENLRQVFQCLGVQPTCETGELQVPRPHHLSRGDQSRKRESGTHSSST